MATRKAWMITRHDATDEDPLTRPYSAEELSTKWMTGQSVSVPLGREMYGETAATSSAWPIRSLSLDRGHSPLGNPYVMRGERDRDHVCNAYAVLLGRTVDGEDLSAEDVFAIGAEHDCVGEVRRWDCGAVRRELSRLARIAEIQPVRLDCHCHPARCHAQCVASALAEWRE